MDLPRYHTKTCMPTGARKQSPNLLESERLSLIGNGFQCGAVAWLLAHVLLDWGLLKSMPEPSSFPGRSRENQGLASEIDAGALVRNLARSVDHKGSD
eukprot:3662387-Karenia_brevis.AAC.1